MLLAEFLKNSREKIKCTQEYVANKIEVSTTTIQNWESGRCKPDINMLSKIAQTYNVSIDDLGKYLISELKENSDLPNSEDRCDFPEWINLFPNIPFISTIKIKNL